MLTNNITKDEIKKIFRNKENKVEYLTYLYKYLKNNTTVPTVNIDKYIMESWDYEISKKVIRQMFMTSEKYKYLKGCKKALNETFRKWNEKNIGTLDWPFSAFRFDQFVHTLNRNETMTDEEKDEYIAKSVIKFRYMKQINTLRNDYIEYLVFQNENVIPTFGNCRGVDFYINGLPYDQKVSKSVGKLFIEKNGIDTYRQIAIENPELVAISLYEGQDRERFGSNSRLLIVYLDSDISREQIEKQLKNINFNNPLEIESISSFV